LRRLRLRSTRTHCEIRRRRLQTRRCEARRCACRATISGIAPLPDAKLFYKPDDYVEIPHDLMRKSIAKRLSSATALIPHFYLTIDCNIDSLMATRARLNEASPKGEGAYKLSVNDFIVKASALALKHVPEVNASWTETAILRHKHADVGVAVALDFGLITPIVFHAEEKGLAVISNEVKSLAERARTKKLKPQEYEGGSFSISNLGMFGIKNFTAVINPPAGVYSGGRRGCATGRHCQRQGGDRDRYDRHHVLRSPGGRRGDGRALPPGLQAVHRRTGRNAAISPRTRVGADMDDLEAILETGGAAAVNWRHPR